MMIAAEKKMLRFTSMADSAMVRNLPRRSMGVRARCSSTERSKRCALGSERWRKMFSTMITVASTIRPKSIAPTDSRFAEFAARHHDDDGEGQRERDGGGGDDRGTQIAEKDPHAPRR